MTDGALYPNAPLQKLVPRKSRKPHRLPKGWRWLKIGEFAMPGDMCCDPRTQPVRIICGYEITSNTWPIRRKVKP